MGRSIVEVKQKQQNRRFFDIEVCRKKKKKEREREEKRVKESDEK